MCSGLYVEFIKTQEGTEGEDGLDYDDGFLRGEDDLDGATQDAPQSDGPSGGMCIFGPFLDDGVVPDQVQVYCARFFAVEAPKPQSPKQTDSAKKKKKNKAELMVGQKLLTGFFTRKST